VRNKSDIISPKYDFCTKALFENEEIRAGFLSDVLGIPRESIRNTRLMNTFLWRIRNRDKQGILDIKIELNDNTKINIELQIVKYENWDRRSLFYLSKIFVEDLRNRQDYSNIRKCIHISILDFDFTENDDAHNIYYFRNNKGELFSEAMEIHTIELRKEISEEEPLYDWIRFYNSQSKEELEMLKTKNHSIRLAIAEVLALSGNEKMRAIRDAEFKANCDRVSFMNAARREGLRAGREEGLAQGREEGIQQGIVKGIEKGIQQGIEEGIQQGIEEGIKKGKLDESAGVNSKEKGKRLQVARGSALPYQVRVRCVGNRVGKSFVEFAMSISKISILYSKASPVYLHD